jgi:predicted PolB exonuclease-like 3'-5' exonuclease
VVADGYKPGVSNDRTAYLIFDIETVIDGRLVQRIRYPDQPQLTAAQAVAAYRTQISDLSGGKSDFVPATFHLPVSVAVAKVDTSFALQEVRTIDRPRFRPQVITRQFWKGWHSYGHPTLVTFNGRGFDLPVMELAAFRYGISVPAWFQSTGPGYSQPRNRYNAQAHLDLQDVLTNHGAVMLTGGLNLCAQLLGKPGKMDTKGSMVQALWEAGEHTRIDDYCICDALDTYFVFLRTRVLNGQLTLSEEQGLVSRARAWIEAAQAENAALTEYLANFQHWQEPGDDDDPFLGANPNVHQA